MRIAAGIAGILGSVAVLLVGMMAFLANGVLIGLRGAYGSHPEHAPAPNLFAIGMISAAAASVALAFSIVLLVRRLPRTASVTLLVAGVVAMMVQNVFGAIVLLAGLLGLAAAMFRPRAPRPAIQGA